MVDRRQLARISQRGLTLIELLVVMVILALASSLVLLNAPPGRTAVQKDAERFAAKLKFAEDEAIATGSQLRLAVDARGYWFEKRVAGEWSREASPRNLQATAFDRSTVGVIAIEDKSLANDDALGAPREIAKRDEKIKYVRLDPIGSPAIFSLTFTSRDGRWIVSSSASGEIETVHE
ncbi:MAG: type II secretion system minor pseudopilin GspH [Parvularculaceae bacterium]